MSRKRPDVLVVGRVRARVVRGPRDDGRWYWRAERYANGDVAVLWTGWGTIYEVELEVAGIVAKRPADVAKPSPDDVKTVYELLDTWVAADALRTDLKERTLVVHKCSANRITKTGLPLLDVRLDRLDRRALEAFRDARIKAGAAPNTVLQEIIVIGQAWRWGRDVGVTPDREPPRCPVKVPYVDRNVPTIATIAAVLGVLDSEHPPWCSRAFRLIAATGARRTEIASLRWCDVEFELDENDRITGCTLRVDGKTGPRRVPLHPLVAAELATWRPDNVHNEARVLGVSIKTVQVDLLNRVKASCRRLKIAPFRLHDVRSSVVGALYSSGADPGVAGAIAGHSAVTALRYYRRATDADLRAAVERAALGVLTVDNVIPLRRKV